MEENKTASNFETSSSDEEEIKAPNVAPASKSKSKKREPKESSSSSKVEAQMKKKTLPKKKKSMKTTPARASKVKMSPSDIPMSLLLGAVIVISVGTLIGFGYNYFSN